MKRIIIFCCLTLMGVDIMAQISGDNNWELIIDEQFSGNRSWDRGFVEEYLDDPDREPIWRCFIDEWNSGVTRGYSEHQVFQRSQCRFNSAENSVDGKMNIIAEHVSDTNLECGDYELLPPSSWHHYHCDSLHPSLFYFSGNIETIEEILYGYFEVRCKLPVHRGAFPAFWLWGGGGSYEEIDIFEYSRSWDTEGTARRFTTGFYKRLEGDSTGYDSFARNYHIIPDAETDLSEWNIFACEWSPKRIIWYLNGKIINHYNGDEVPSHPMTLKINYSIDNYALNNGNPPIPAWKGTDSLSIDYIKVYQLKKDCDTDVVIENTEQLVNYEGGHKRSIFIGSVENAIAAPDNLNLTLRASESITIDGAFELPRGAKLNIIVHGCP